MSLKKGGINHKKIIVLRTGIYLFLLASLCWFGVVATNIIDFEPFTLKFLTNVDSSLVQTLFSLGNIVNDNLWVRPSHSEEYIYIHSVTLTIWYKMSCIQ